jgi:two-component system alkaline phosphatase synthesis response regulator PhoP
MMMTSSPATPDANRLQEARFPGARILVVDDELSLRRTLTHMLDRMGYRAAAVASGEEALHHIDRHDVDLVVLDLKMPGMDGVEVLETARPMASDTVFVILTAYGTLESAISGIRHGAFDYLLKPSPMEEIVKTIEAGLAERERRLHQDDPVALLERALHTLKSHPEQEEPSPSEHARSKGRFLQASDVTVDLRRKMVVVRSEPVDLTPTEFDILVYMMRRRDRVSSCREIVAEIRGHAMDERDARMLLHSHIHRLRQKIEEDPADPELIRTIRGEGYLFATQPDSPILS